MKRTFLLLVIIVLPFWGNQLLNAQTVNSDVEKLVRSNNLKHALVGFKLLDLSSNKVIAAHNEHKSLIPASVMKVVSIAAAVDYLGPEYKYETSLYYTGTIANGVLSGDIIIEGKNDPSLGSSYISVAKEKFLTDWLAAIRKAGIKTIKGRIVVADKEHRGEYEIHPQWLWEDIGNYYAPGIYGISVFDNVFSVSFKSGSKATGASITNIEPKIDELTFVNNIRINNTQPNDVYINGIPYSYDRRLNGTMKENQSSYVAKADIPDPAMFLANYFTDYLKKNAISVEKTPTTTRKGYVTPNQLTKIHTTYSPSLSNLIKVVNFRSNNHYTEYIYQTFLEKRKIPLGEYLESKGLDTSGQFIYDASGLSPKNAISASFITDVLSYMRKSKSSDAYFQSLPLAGREGTVATFLKGSKLEGNARIKSGSISNVQTYAGYISYGGKEYAFAILVNNFTGTRSAVRKQIEQLLISCF